METLSQYQAREVSRKTKWQKRPYQHSHLNLASKKFLNPKLQGHKNPSLNNQKVTKVVTVTQTSKVGHSPPHS